MDRRAIRVGEPIWSELIEDYARFHGLEMASGSVDPVYRVLRRMSEQHHTAREMALLSFLHVAYYDLGSALRAFGELGGRVDFGAIPRLATLRCGTERRGMRDHRQLERHLHNLFEIDAAWAGLDQWAYRWIGHGQMYGALQGIYGNGRWAAYKTSELLSWSMAPYFPSAAPAWEPDNMGHAHSSGPRAGLDLVTKLVLPTGHSTAAVRRLDAVSDELVAYLRRAGLPASPATVETTLCDFNSMYRGRYYPGHDIHQLNEQLVRAWADVEQTKHLVGFGALRSGLDAARKEFGAEALLPVDKARKARYKTTGRFEA